MPDIFEYAQGNSPLLISFPHDGMDIPPELNSSFNKLGKSNIDCDWFISTLYDFVLDLDISFIKPRYSRYVVDLNRPPDGERLYPGKMETGICPLTTFSAEAIYSTGKEPTKDEVQSRIDSYWKPYHKHISDELVRIKAIHGHAILWDAHSIRAEAPLLFDGVLADLSFGSADGCSCDNTLLSEVVDIAREYSAYSVVVNDRFKGGYITRHYGRPIDNINAIQLEINQSNYLTNSEPPLVAHEKAGQLSQLLQRFICFLAKSD